MVLYNDQLSNTMYLNQTPNVPSNNMYAKGGTVKKNKLTYAHMAPHELDVLDHLQGVREKNKKTKVRSYEPLEHLLSNPHVREKVLHMARQHKANGGMIDGGEAADARAHAAVGNHGEDADKKKYINLLLEKMKRFPDQMKPEEIEFLKHEGVHGDRELAAIGPHTHKFLDEMAGHKTHNQNTGMPEYWSLGSALGGLWDGIKEKAGQAVDFVKKEAPGALRGIAHAVAPHIGGAINKKLGGYFGKDSALGSGLQKVIGIGAKGIQNYAEKGGMSNAGRMIGSGLAGAVKNRSLTSGLESAGKMGHKLGERGATNVLNNVARTRREGGGYGQQLTNAYRGGTGQSYVGNKEYGQGQGVKRSIAQGIGQGINSAMNGKNPREAIRGGARQAMNTYGTRNDPRANRVDPAHQLPQQPRGKFDDYDTAGMFRE